VNGLVFVLRWRGLGKKRFTKSLLLRTVTRPCRQL